MVVESITRLDHVLGMLEKRASSEFHGAMHPISVRMPIIAAATIDAFAKHSGHSKNRIIIELLELAIEEVTSQISEEDGERITKLRSKILREMVGPEEAPNEFSQATAED